MSLRPVLAAALLLAAQVPRLDGAPADAAVPAAVREAERAVKPWLESLRGRTRAAAEQELGPPLEDTTWASGEGPLPLLRWRTPTGAKLDLYFGPGGTAVVVDYGLLVK